LFCDFSARKGVDLNQFRSKHNAKGMAFGGRLTKRCLSFVSSSGFALAAKLSLVIMAEV
jgi:hypothetical protein